MAEPRIGFEDRVAVITGSGRGLGRLYATELARRGARVVVNSRPGKDGQPATADAVVEEIRANGGTAVGNTTSVETPEGARAVIGTALEEFGKLDILINNAGINHGAAVENITPEDLAALVAVHINGTTWATAAAVPHMRERGYGRIVMTASHNGIFARPRSTAYGTVKSAILGLGHSCAIELEPDGILVNTVLPVGDTGWSQWIPPDVEKLMADALAPAWPDIDSLWAVNLATYLASDACTTAGGMYSAIAGHYSRVFIGLTPGWQAPDDSDDIAADLADHFDEVRDRAGYTAPWTMYEAFTDELAMLRARRG